MQIYSKVLEEQISTSYFNLLAHFPDTRSQFVDMFQALNDIEETISNDFHEQTQQDVLAFEGKEGKYTSAMLGNALRTTAAKLKEQFMSQTSTTISPVRELLFDIIARSNKQILQVNRNGKSC
jgi:hypothetical protein